MLYVSSESSFISTQFFCRKLYFGIPLLCYCINLISSIVFCLFSGDKFLSFGIFLSSPTFPGSFVTVSELFCGHVLETFMILLAILLPVRSPVASASIDLSEANLSASVANCLAWSRRFWLYLLLKFLPNIFAHILINN